MGFQAENVPFLDDLSMSLSDSFEYVYRFWSTWEQFGGFGRVSEHLGDFWRIRERLD